MPRRPFLLRLAAACACWLFAAAAAADKPVLIAAAADLKFALEEIATAFQRETGLAVSVSYGSSGTFRRQIGQGAPYEVFFSADESYVEALAKQGRTEGEGTLYAVGRLALFLPNGSPVKADRRLQDLGAAAADGRLKRLAIANPEHAPYGRAAVQVLQYLGLWSALQDKLVLGENAAQAAQFAMSGSAQAGLIPYSLVLAPGTAQRGAFLTLPDAWHTPLRQRMVLIKGAGETARRFYRFVQTPAARAILDRNGFAAPAASN